MKRRLAAVSLGIFAGTLLGGNLIQNGNFELENQGWVGSLDTRGNYVLGIQLGWDVKAKPYLEFLPDKTAPGGRHVAVCTGVRDQVFSGMVSRPYQLSGGKYELSGFYRSTSALQVVCGDLLKKSLSPSRDWKKFSLSLDVPANKEKLVYLHFSIQKKGEFRVDDIRLVKQGDTQPDFPVETRAKILSADHIFMRSEARKAELQAYAGKGAEGILRYGIRDISGKTLFSGEFKLKLAAGEFWKKEISLPGDLYGTFHLMTEFVSGGKRVSPEGESLFSVIPDRKLPTSPEDGYGSRFGCNMGGGRRFPEIARKIGIRWVMCAPPIFTKWMVTQPRPDEWIFYDRLVDTYSKAGLNLLGNLADAPWWATHPGHKGYGGPWPNSKKPTDMKTWDEYVRRTVTHYYPKIKDWIVGNEPDHVSFFGFDPETSWCERFADLQKRTYRIVKSVNPKIRVAAAGTTHSGSLRQLLDETDIIHDMDIGAYHFAAWSPVGYTRLTPEERGEIPMNVRKMNKIMERKGKKILLWNTEAHLTQAHFEREYFTQPTLREYRGKPIKQIYTRMDAVNSVAKMYLSEWAIGIDKTFFWFLNHVSPFGGSRTESTIMEWDGAPTAVLPAYAAMTHFLEGAKMDSWNMEKHPELSGKPRIWSYCFSRGKEKIRVFYTDKDRKVRREIPAAENAVVYDVFGNPLKEIVRNAQGCFALQLDRTPVYLVE